MPLYSLANNATTTLNGNINNSTTSVVVTAATGFPSSGSYVILIDAELMLVTAGQGTTTWTVTRNIESTSAASHTSGATIAHVLSAGTLTNNYADLFSNQTIAGTKTFSVTPPGLVDTTSTQTLQAKTINSYPKFLGIDNGGGGPSLTNNFQMSAGSTVINADALGQATITFQNSFSNAPIMVLAGNGDPTAGPDVLVTVSGSSAGNFSVKCYNANTNAPHAGALRINWIAIGY